MAIVSPPLKIVNYPHPALKHPAKPLTAIDANVLRIAEAMGELMREQNGLGLAAPQVGLPFRMFVANFTAKDNPDGPVDVFINPVIQEKSGSTVEAEEGCLSFPGLYRKVRRARSVSVQAYNLQGQLLALELSDLPARIWQHESDHLDGVLFIDKLGFIAQMTVRSELDKFEREYKKAQKKGEIPPDDAIERYLAELEASGPPEIPPREPPACAS
jgi:peptide deformylase